MANEHTPPADLQAASLPASSDEWIAQYVANNGALSAEEQAVLSKCRPMMDRVISIAARLGNLDGDDARTGIATLVDIVELIADLREARRAEHDAQFEALRAAFRTYSDILDPDRRDRALASIIRDKLFVDQADDKIKPILEAYAGLDGKHQKQLRFILRMIQTEDAFGIIVRGSVLVEAILEECIWAYVPNPDGLFSKLRLFADGKIALAHMLGIISAPEKSLLDSLNKLRNKVAHAHRSPGPDRGPDFEVTWSDEKSYWAQFAENDACSADWPQYDKAEFPGGFRRIFFYTYLMLAHRLGELSERKMANISEELSPTQNTRHLRAAMTIAFVRVFTAMAGTVLEEPAINSGEISAASLVNRNGEVEAR